MADEQLERVAQALAGHYEIQRELGQGGMATVYLARDIKHDRLVAVKVLHPDLAASLGTDRFLREIQITAKLSHPHILPLFDSGAAGGFLYYVMPYVEGETLAEFMVRERQLAIPEAVKIAQEVAGALAHAHSYGLVHRDIKPSNILMTGGHAVVADFGIARAIQEAGSEKLTHTGMAVGTPAYMSPEQAAGGPGLDGRSDLYSLGCVLYEMVVGQVPFTGPTPQAIMARHSMDHVTAPHIMRDTVPGELEEVMLTVLAKSPADRYRTAQEFAEALSKADTTSAVVRKLTGAQPRRRRRRVLVPAGVALGAVAAAGAAWALFGGSGGRDTVSTGELDPRRIAVLYFEDSSADEELSFLADGLTEGLIDQLSQVRALDVVSRNGVAQFRDADVSRDSIARALDVGTLILGSVEPVGNDRLRVTTRLVDGGSGADFGRASFEVPQGAVLAVRDSVTRDISRSLRARVGEEIRLRERRSGTSSVEAWMLVQRAERLRKEAEDHFGHGELDDGLSLLARADTFLARAETLDDGWADPIAQRARIAYLRAWRLALRGHSRDADEAIQNGLNLGQRALERDPVHPDAHEQLGRLKYLRWLANLEHDAAAADALLQAAERDLLRATELNPSQAGAWNILSHLYVGGKHDFAAANYAARRAYEADAYLEAVDATLYRLFTTAYNLEQFEQAAHWCEAEGYRRFPDDPTFTDCRLLLLSTDAKEPDVTAAWRLADSVAELTPGHGRELALRKARVGVAAVLARAGLPDSARHVLEEARWEREIDPARELVPRHAWVRILLNDQGEALRLLSEYFAANREYREGMGKSLHWWWRGLENNPQFRALLGR